MYNNVKLYHSLLPFLIKK